MHGVLQRFVCACALALLASITSATFAEEPANDENAQAPKAGIGLALRIDDGKVFVGSILPDTPSDRANAFHAGDRILTVATGSDEPVSVTGLKMAKVVGLIRGDAGTVVRLTIVPAGKDESEARVVSMVRGEIKELNLFGDGRLLPTGTKAPNFKFRQPADGDEGELSELSGKIVVLDFWASWCGPCTTSIERLNDLREQHPEWNTRVVILAVGADETKEEAASSAIGVRWSNSSTISTVWAGADVLKAYHVNALPTHYLIDQHGNIAAWDPETDDVKSLEQTIEQMLRE